jgi:membrane protein DedA with SNARE-associated domain
VHDAGVWQDAWMVDQPRSGEDPPNPVATSATSSMARAPESVRLSDGMALGLFGAWLVFRTITQRVGIAIAPRSWVLVGKPWLIPLLNNSSLLLIQAGIGTSGRPGMFVVTMLASVFMSTIVGLVLYWAGWRFGHRLAEMAQRPGSPWAGIWNPKQIARAERWMDRWGMPVVFVARVVEFFTLPVTLVAGASDMRLRRFLVANTLGSFAFAGTFLWLGGEAQRRWPGLKDWISDTYAPWALRIGLALIVLLVILMTLGSKLDKKKGAEEDAGDADMTSADSSGVAPGAGEHPSDPGSGPAAEPGSSGGRTDI